MTRFEPAKFPSGRILLVSGNVDLGAVFPPVGSGKTWRWSLFGLGAFHRNTGKAKTEEQAKKELLSRWQEWLRAAELTEITP